MQNKPLLFVIGLPTFLSGCAIHPLPEDFSRNNTLDIVQKIRCEAREAIRISAVREPEKLEDNLNRIARQLPDMVKADLEGVRRKVKSAQKRLSEIEGKADSAPKPPARPLRQGGTDLEPAPNTPLGPDWSEDDAIKAKAESDVENAKRELKEWKSDEAQAKVETREVGYLLRDGFEKAAIGYGFKFTLSEKDNGRGSSTFIFPFTSGKVSLDVTMGEDKERKNERIFDLSENFTSILSDETLRTQCVAPPESWKYPITGNIGLQEVVATYVGLAELSHVGLRKLRKSAGDSKKGGREEEKNKDEKNKEEKSSKGAEETDFSDVLTFTTTYGGSVTPTIELAPVKHDFRLTKATASLGGERKDVHAVTIALVKIYAPADESPRSQSYSYRTGPTPDETNLKAILRERRFLDSLERRGF